MANSVEGRNPARIDVQHANPATRITLARAVAYEVGKDLETYRATLGGEKDFALALLEEKHIYAQEMVQEAETALGVERTRRIEAAKDYQELLAVAFWEITEHGFDTMASFPIFTGAESRSPQENIAYAEALIHYVSAYGYRVWSQVPYLDMNIALGGGPLVRDSRKKFEEFYEPLVSSGKFARVVMLPGWDQSEGCKSELQYAQSAGSEIVYIGDEWEKDTRLTDICVRKKEGEGEEW